MRRRFLALPLLAVVLLVSPVPSRTEEAEGELLVPGPPLERPIAAGEKHRYRVEVKDDPVLVLVEQQGIDLVVEARGPAEQTLVASAPNDRWGPEVLLLSTAGAHRIELRSKESAGPGRYTIAVETLSGTSPEEIARRQAWALMSRAGQESFAETPEGRKQATASYREAKALWRAIEDHRWEAEAQLNVAGPRCGSRRAPPSRRRGSARSCRSSFAAAH